MCRLVVALFHLVLCCSRERQRWIMCAARPRSPGLRSVHVESFCSLPCFVPAFGNVVSVWPAPASLVLPSSDTPLLPSPSHHSSLRLPLSCQKFAMGWRNKSMSGSNDRKVRTLNDKINAEEAVARMAEVSGRRTRMHVCALLRGSALYTVCPPRIVLPHWRLSPFLSVVCRSALLI